jgi:hypothetical protein
VRDARNSKGQLSHAGQLTFVLYLIMYPENWTGD